MNGRINENESKGAKRETKKRRRRGQERKISEQWVKERK
jgi:hypothetical protein